MSVRGWLLLGLLLHAGTAVAHGAAVCTPTSEITAARNARERDPNALAMRLNLVDALVRGGCDDEALHELEAVLELEPKNAEVQRRLRTVRSNVAEREYFAGLDDAQAEARLSRNLLRCRQLGDIAACDEAQRAKPDDGAIATAKADALLKADRPALALVTLRRAATLAPADTAIATKVRDVESQRASLMRQCLTEGQVSLGPCEGALLAGEPDEFALRQRIAVIHQSNNRLSDALDAFIAARALRRGDESVARAIVSLVDSSGRKDAGALAARGTSLLTLGRATEALSSLQQAQALAPGFPEIAAALATAERQARLDEQNAAERRAVANTARAPAPQAMVAAPSPPSVRTYSNAAAPNRSY